MRSYLNGSRRVCRVMSALQTAFILAMVPYGRAVEPYLAAVVRVFKDRPGFSVACALIVPALSLYLYTRLLAGSPAWFRIVLVVSIFSMGTLSAYLMIGVIEAGHIVSYGAFSSFVAIGWAPPAGEQPRSYSTFWVPPFVKVSLATVLLSLVDEGLQGLHPARFFDARDILLNYCGALLGLLLVLPILEPRFKVA